jgi:hypothetical protein
MIREPSFKKGIFCAQKARWMVKNANPGFWGPELFQFTPANWYHRRKIGKAYW